MDNQETKVIEELLFELFHQAGPVIKVKIPKGKEGQPKQFAFVNAMNLLMELNFLEGPSKSRLDQEVATPHRTAVCPVPSNVLEVQALPPRLLAGTKDGG